MAKKNGRFKMFRSMVDVSSWMNVKNIRDSGEDIVKTFADIKATRPPAREETFEEAISRLGLNDQVLQKRMRDCLYSGWFYFACAFGLFIYGCYLLIQVYFLSACVAWVLSALATVLAYREAFWYFQMKTRKLGRTFTEFVAFITGRK